MNFELYNNCLGSILMYFLLDFPWFVETVGFLAVFTERPVGVRRFTWQIWEQAPNLHSPTS